MRRVLPSLLSLLLLAACQSRREVPTLVLEPGPFRHRVTAEGLLEAAQVTVLSVPSEVRGTVRLAWIAPDGAAVAAGDLVARFDSLKAEEQLLEGRWEMEQVGQRRLRTEQEGRGRQVEIDTEIEVSDLELGVAERFGLDDDDVFSRHEIIESEIDETLARERRAHALAARDTERSLARTELELLGIEARKADLAIDRAASALEALEVRAPHDGLLRRARDWSNEPLGVGSELWRGQQIAEIPDLSAMQAEVFVLEADAGGLAVGQPATVVVEARPDVAHPARIERIDKVAKRRFRRSPVQYFGVTLAFERMPEDADLKPGQRVRATLHLAEKDETLVVPRQALVAEGGRYRLFVRGAGGDFVPREVELGASSPGLIEIVGGVRAGEVVALRPPAGVGAPQTGEASPETARADGAVSSTAGGASP